MIRKTLFNSGDKIICIKDRFSSKEWENVGICDVLFKVGDILTFKQQGCDEEYKNANSPGIKLEEIPDWYYPPEGFELYKKHNIKQNYKYLIKILRKYGIT